MMHYEIRQCTATSCAFRFPAAEDQRSGDRCPWCGAPTQVVHRLPIVAQTAETHLSEGGRMPLAGLLDNVRSLFNVGSIFRSADGAGLSHLYLGGVTPTPDHRKLAKTALGAEQHLSWSHHRNSVALAETLRASGHVLWALETGGAAVSIFDIEAPPLPLVLVVGNEVTGVDPDLLALCARCVSIPMAGRKQSLNVATAFGIAAVILRHRCDGALGAQPSGSLESQVPL
ncbi:RNA methyltransferase [Caldilinea sp.]|uniref:RNA methyltransferase n=1 Tax=Caldilinea sp. TaxID=2293560 RepID=UPI002CC2D1AE|nr:RNA methyltransferase [Anaerolineales bacterium]HQY92973.1 RNA methyltransferase [Caldilinea sp.]HRA68790.1 RNA methyltransferase [Caldilinea sp.]